MRGGTVWRLGWWAPLPPALEPDDVVDPTVHGALLSAVADGAPLDRVGQHRLDALKAAGLATADGRPRFPVARAAQAKAVADAAGDLGRAVARLLAGEWSRLEVEYEPVHATVAGGGGQAAFLVVGGLVLDLGVRRLLRRQGLAAPPFGSAFLWLAEGELAAVDPEAAPALPATREPALRELSEGLGWSVVRLVEDALPVLDPVRRRIAGGEDEGAFLAWAYTLAVDEALERLTDRGLVAPPATGVVAVRVADPALAGM